MSAQIVNIATAVTAALAAFGATREYRPVFDRKATATRRVVVVPVTRIDELYSRTSVQADVQVDVGYLKALDASHDSAEGLAEIDGHMLEVESIGSLFIGNNLPAPLDEWGCIAIDSIPIYSGEHLERLNQFTAVLRLTFRGSR